MKLTRRALLTGSAAAAVSAALPKLPGGIGHASAARYPTIEILGGAPYKVLFSHYARGLEGHGQEDVTRSITAQEYQASMANLMKLRDGIYRQMDITYGDPVKTVDYQQKERKVIPKSLQKNQKEFVAEVTEILKSGQEVSIPGIGKLVAIDKAERQGIDFQTREPMTIAAHKAVKFSPAKALKEAVNGK